MHLNKSIGIILMVLPLGLLAQDTSVQAQSEGYVPQIYQPTPRIGAQSGPFGPPPEAALTHPKGKVVPKLDNKALQVNQPEANYPAILQPKDFFGRSYNPQAAYYDPFNSSARLDGKPVGPNDPPVIAERVKKMEVNPYSSPEIVVAEEVWVTLILLREGEIVRPSATLEGTKEILIVKKSAANANPYLYLQAGNGTTNLAQPVRTSLDVDVVDKQGKVLNYKFNVVVRQSDNPDFSPTVQVNMVNSELPPMYGASGSKFSANGGYAAVADSIPAASNQPVYGTANSYTPNTSLNSGYSVSQYKSQMGNSLTNGSTRKAVQSGQKMTRDEIQKIFPIMIGMSKAYEEAVAARASGYSTQDIIRFRPSTILQGQIINDTNQIPAFKNPFDDQLYFAIWGYFFPRYDAIIYEISLRNTSGRDIWWDYSLLRIIPGFEPSDQAIKVTVASPEMGEVTPDGGVNTIWVLVQGRALSHQTPIRLAFPPQGRDSTLRPFIQSSPMRKDESQTPVNFTLTAPERIIR